MLRSAYVDGRLDRVYADYTGVVVNQGDRLALVYSPRLYSSQVELLLARGTRGEGRPPAPSRLLPSRPGLYESARQRLLELGMTETQIQQLEEAGEANSRMHLVAPISGTVIEKLADEGEYVKEGQAIYKLADLSSLWLVLEMFPEDAAAVRFGQRVEAAVQSLPGQRFAGRVAFVDPSVDAGTRTVGVRIVIPNEAGLLRVGDFARADVQVPLGRSGQERPEVYDPDLAEKWISPRHPHIIKDGPGKCPVCGMDLVPAADFGYASHPVADEEALVVPREAVLMAGDNSVLYVESAPGCFEIRRVVTGPNCGDRMVIISGVEEGERVATAGNFLIDSQMQLAGNPSLIDPSARGTGLDEPSAGQMAAGELAAGELAAALADLSPQDRASAESQRLCPVTSLPLGSMGTPPKVDVEGRTLFICCEGCRTRLLENPDKFLAKLAVADVSRESKLGHSMNLPPIGKIEPLEVPAEPSPAGPSRAVDEGGSEAGRHESVVELPGKVVR